MVVSQCEVDVQIDVQNDTENAVQIKCDKWSYRDSAKPRFFDSGMRSSLTPGTKLASRKAIPIANCEYLQQQDWHARCPVQHCLVCPGFCVRLVFL